MSYYGNQDRDRDRDQDRDQDRDRGRSRERNGRDSDRRDGGGNRSRSRYDSEGRGYEEDRRSRGDSNGHRDSSQNDRRGYHHQDSRGAYDGQGQNRRHSGGGQYGPQGNHGYGGGGPRGNNDSRRAVDSAYGPGSHPGHEHQGASRNSEGGRERERERGPPRDGRYGGSGGGGRYGGDRGGGGGGDRGGGGGGRYGGDRGGGGGGGGGGDRGRGHRGGGHRGGGRGGRYGGGGGGGRDPGPDLSGMQACTTNILKAELTEGFHFYQYSINAQNSSGEVIESSYRRRFLFNVGFWDGLLRDLPRNEKNDLRKVVFFNGSTFYSGRSIRGLEAASLDDSPYEMNFGDRGEGDTMQVIGVKKLLAPIELQTPRTDHGPNEVRFDNRTANARRSFQDQQALLQYCRQTGNEPAYVPDDGTPATLPEFLAYVNSVLQSALGAKLPKWGRDLVNPNMVTQPRARGLSLGVSIYHAYRCEFSVLKKPDEESTVIVSEEKKSEEKKAKVKGVLALTVDLGAKVLRDKSVLNDLVRRGESGSAEERAAANAYNPSEAEKAAAKREWIGQIVITKHDK
ncbi:MAG: hypothetical protein SGBAC_011749, partial [Bacillariaceae sp.]